MKTWIVDTGPLVAFLDASDSEHDAVAAVLAGFSGRLVTTSAVITETMHLIAGVARGPRALLELLVRASVQVVDPCQGSELVTAVALMEKYADTPMDFADASLMVLADGLNVRDVLTLDRRGFSTYRTRGRQPLRLVLDG